jgi:ATP-dependent DNA ligase
LSTAEKARHGFGENADALFWTLEAPSFNSAPMLDCSRGTVGFIEPCLPSPAKAAPNGPDWLHEIKHDGSRIRVWR